MPKIKQTQKLLPQEALIFFKTVFIWIIQWVNSWCRLWEQIQDSPRDFNNQGLNSEWVLLIRHLLARLRFYLILLWISLRYISMVLDYLKCISLTCWVKHFTKKFLLKKLISL